MLDDDAGGHPCGIEFGNALERRVGIVDVVVGELPALQLAGSGHAATQVGSAVECRRLVRVLAVAQRLDQLPCERTICRCGVGQLLREPIGDCGIVGGGAGIGLGGELASQRQRGRAVVPVELREHGRIVVGIDDDHHVLVVLGGGADHGRPSDVDILDAGLERGPLRDGCFEGVEVDHQEIDRANPVCFDRRCVIRIAARREQAAMDLGVQRLYATVHHLRKPRELGDVEHGEAGGGQHLAGAAGGDQLDPPGG